MSETNHITKHTHTDGKELHPHLAWCGEPATGWHYTDAQHAALSIEHDDHASWYVCLGCVDAIANTLALARLQRADDAP